MNVEDMILVSIDDHVIEPRDMFERHVPEKYRDDAPQSRDERRAASSSGSSRARPRDRWASTRSSRWPKEEWGMDPIELRRDASRRVRRARARPRHEPQRHPRRRCASRRSPGFSGGTFRRRRRQGPLARSCSRRTTTGTSTSGAPRTPVASSRSRIAPIWDPRGDGRRDPAGRRPRAARAMTLPGASRTSRVCPATTTSTTGAPCSEAVSEEQVVMCLHIGQGFAAINIAPDAPIDNLIILATQVSALAAQDLLWGPALPHLPRPQGRVVGSRDRLDPVLPRPLRPSLHEPAVARARLRRQDAERHLPRPLARVLRDRSRRAQGASRHRDRHHRLGVRLPALRLDLARRARGRARASSTAPSVTDDEIHKITWENSVPALPLRSVRAHREGSGNGRRTPGAGHPTSTPRSGRGPSGASATRRGRG